MNAKTAPTPVSVEVKVPGRPAGSSGEMTMVVTPDSADAERVYIKLPRSPRVSISMEELKFAMATVTYTRKNDT